MNKTRTRRHRRCPSSQVLLEPLAMHSPRHLAARFLPRNFRLPKKGNIKGDLLVVPTMARLRIPVPADKINQMPSDHRNSEYVWGD